MADSCRSMGVHPRVPAWHRLDEGGCRDSRTLDVRCPWYDLLGQFAFNVAPFPPAVPPPGASPSLNYPPPSAIHLTDGLQRFAIGTSILNALDGIGVFGTGAVAANLPRLGRHIAALIARSCGSTITYC